MPAKGGLIILKRGLAFKNINITRKAVSANQQATDQFPDNL